MTTFLATVFLAITAFCAGTFSPPAGGDKYRWSNVTPAANYPQGYNYPVYIFGDWMVALNNGAWLSKDGKRWVKTELPDSGLNSAYQKYVQFNGSIYALGALSGNYERFSITPKILRTTDLNKWETVSERSNIPQRVFYGLTVFNGKMWMLGGYDGTNYHNDVWTSVDGVHWEQLSRSAEWSPRKVGSIAVFNNKLWILGGGEIDGDKVANPNSQNEVWSSPDGIKWTMEASRILKSGNFVGGTVGVYDNKMWIVGANRNNVFQSGVLYSEDGRTWNEMTAPWSPRGAVAVWVFDNKLFMTGGKSSHTENGEIKFVYSNDVWSMERKSE